MRELLKSFKTEINPTEEQKVKICKTIGTCRFIYNFYLAHNKELHESGKKFMSSNEFRIWLNNEYLKDYKVVRIGISGLSPLTHYRFGQCIKEAVEDKNVLLIASGDLSHCLKEDGPYDYKLVAKNQ